jgi:hypothetical protein
MSDELLKIEKLLYLEIILYTSVTKTTFQNTLYQYAAIVETDIQTSQCKIMLLVHTAYMKEKERGNMIRSNV